jgi:predicted metallo-beta-lactamase superfamily hydrolase
MTYMMGFRYSKKNYEVSLKNLSKVIEETKVKKLALEHHLLRDIKWDEKIADVYKIAKKRKVKVLSFAEFAGKENEIFEARRKELWKDIK